MSGRYDCLTCGGHGWVVSDDEPNETSAICPTCKGTGERWLGMIPVCEELRTDDEAAP